MLIKCPSLGRRRVEDLFPHVTTWTMAGPNAHKRNVVKHKTHGPRAKGGFKVGGENAAAGSYIGKGVYRLTSKKDKIRADSQGQGIEGLLQDA